jgi:hypothetical protein
MTYPSPTFNILDHIENLQIVKTTTTEYICICPICGDDNLKINLGRHDRHGAYKCWSNQCPSEEIRNAIAPLETAQGRQKTAVKQVPLPKGANPALLTEELKAEDFFGKDREPQEPFSSGLSSQEYADLAKDELGGSPLGDDDLDLKELLRQTHCPTLFHENLTSPLVEVAKAMGLTIEPFVVCALPVIASRFKVGTQLMINPTTNHIAPPVIWAGLVGDSGTMKSPLLDTLTQPLVDLQNEECSRYDDEQDIYKAECRGWAALKKEQQADKPEPMPPHQKSLYFDDLTIEAISASIKHYPGNGSLINKDELSGFFRSMDAYRSGGGDRQKWLTAYNGGGLKIDRKGSDPIFVRKTSLSLLGGIQPSVLEREIAKDPTSSDGLWPRFIWCRLPMVIPPGIGDSKPSKLPDVLKSLYEKINELEPKTYGLSRSAIQVWNEWNQEIGELMMEEPSEFLRTIYPKLKGVADRIALITHVTNATLDGSTPCEHISGETLTTAIAFTRWLMGQTRSLYCEIGVSGSPEDARIAKFISRFEGKGWVSPKVARGWWAARKKPSMDEIRKWMSELVKLKYAENNGLDPSDTNYQIRICSQRSHVVTLDPETYAQQEESAMTTRSHPVVIPVVTPTVIESAMTTPLTTAMTTGSHPQEPSLESISPSTVTTLTTVTTRSLVDKTSVEPAQAINTEEVIQDDEY